MSRTSTSRHGDEVGPGEDTPMWLSHHWPEDHGRCIPVRGRMVCRRCLVLYPTSLLVVIVFGLWLSWPHRLDPWLLWLLPLPAVAELAGEQLGVLRPNARRLVAVTVPLGIACGRLYLRYLDDRTDALVLAVVGLYGGLCALLVVFAGSVRMRRQHASSGSAGVEPPPADDDGTDEVTRTS